MSDGVQIALINGIVTIAAVAVSRWFSSRENQVTAAKVAVVADKVEQVHLATNSLQDKLVAKTEQEALQRGGIEERARADKAKTEFREEGR